MKKLAILLCALSVIAGAANANEPVNKQETTAKGCEQQVKLPPKNDIHKAKKAHENAFEQKLGLTEVQKLKARELRKEGFAKMKPVMDEIRAKKQEAEAIRRSKLTVAEQEEKLIVIDKDLAALQKQASEIKKQNMKDFESILTREQKRTLKKMKKEGREKFENNRKLVPPPCPVPKPVQEKI